MTGFPRVLLVLGLAACTGPFLHGCFLAPQAAPGSPMGSTCGTDLECATDLLCSCGTCVAISDDPMPPSCDVAPDDRCPAVASECFISCGVETVVGLANCIEGRETCEASDGVLFESCGEAVCWGDAAPGETCFEGEWTCQFGVNVETETCYTFDCAGEAVECVLSCADDETSVQICLADEWTCEFGFPVAQCGGCVGTPPDCFDTCTDLNVISAATCLENEWSCEHIVDAQLESICCVDELLLLSDESFAANEDVLCTSGTLLVRYQTTSNLTLPNLKQTGDLFFYENESTGIFLPSLERVGGAFSVWMNPNLSEVSLPRLNAISESLEIAFNDALPACRAEEIASAVGSIGGQTFVNDNDGAGGCVDGGVTDAGVNLPDGGLPEGDGGADGGATPPADAGSFDGGLGADAGGASDAGPGAADGG